MDGFPVHLRDGFNFVTAVRESLPDQGTVSTQYMFLLNVAQTPFGRAVSAVRLSPQVATNSASLSPMITTTMACELEISYECYKSDTDSETSVHWHSHASRFPVPCIDPFTAELPDPSVNFQFFIPKCLPDYDGAAFNVMAAITLSR
ncbi:hypothetical protein PR202_ga11299 [Eleusine coracana subsp. coracana]|uniref:Uncharacterized protein n=1 Tax=Eleusine coracana subsp. coracana TaxID=191504 RepID=A0AAV5C956_ELECO|nr:hypothetical protein PR202_ga11299 [Eleusine coracana subsp. coracana]